MVQSRLWVPQGWASSSHGRTSLAEQRIQGGRGAMRSPPTPTPTVLLETHPILMKTKGTKTSCALLFIVVGEAHETGSNKV